MNYKKEKFSLDLLRKIFSGEEKGTVALDCDGDVPIRIICVDRCDCDENGDSKPIVALLSTEAIEEVELFDEDGYNPEGHLSLYVEIPEVEIKPFDKVIAAYGQGSGDKEWVCDIFSHVEPAIKDFPYYCIGDCFSTVHPWKDCYTRFLGTDRAWEQIVIDTAE